MTEPTIYGIGATEFQPQPDFTATQTKTGAWEATQTFICRESALSDDAFRNRFTAGVSPISLDGDLDLYWARLNLSHVDWTNIAGGLAEVVVHYAGFGTNSSSGAETEAPTYELTAEVARISMMEHPKVVALAEDRIAYLSRVHRGYILYDGTNWTDEWLFNIDGPAAGDTTVFAKLMAQGHLTFERKTLVWTKRWSASSGFSTGQVGSIGEIETPSGTYPAVGGHTWIVSDVYQSSTGGLFRKSKSWTMSVDGGWDTDVY